MSHKTLLCLIFTDTYFSSACKGAFYMMIHFDNDIKSFPSKRENIYIFDILSLSDYYRNERRWKYTSAIGEVKK